MHILKSEFDLHLSCRISLQTNQQSYDCGFSLLNCSSYQMYHQV